VSKRCQKLARTHAGSVLVRERRHRNFNVALVFLNQFEISPLKSHSVSRAHREQAPRAGRMHARGRCEENDMLDAPIKIERQHGDDRPEAHAREERERHGLLAV
jgi:hypothetical protein